jgi:hypothetical protein
MSLLCAVLLLNYFPSQWKVAQIILILKRGKHPYALTSYRSISLLPIVSKVLEKLLLTRLLPLVEHIGLMPSHQFGFREKHSTTEQTHRIIHRINEAFEHKAYCSATFLDICQAFDKVWRIGLLYKLRQSLSINYFLLLQSFLENSNFLVRFGSAQHPQSTPVFHKAVFSGRSYIPYTPRTFQPTQQQPQQPLLMTQQFSQRTVTQP